MSDRDLLLRILDDAYERKAWHGTNLRGPLRGVTPDAARWRPAPGRHNIWELAVHCAYWKYTVRRKLTGEKRGSFPRKGSNWIAPGDDWQSDLRLLGDQHRALHSAIDAASAQQLRKLERLLYGVAAHDAYHTGQIQLIKRLRGRDGRRERSSL